MGSRAKSSMMSVGEEGLADADRTQDYGIAMVLDEAERNELAQHPAVVGHLGTLVPALQSHVGVEPGGVSATVCRVAVPTGDFIGEKQKRQRLPRRAWRKPMGREQAQALATKRSYDDVDPERAWE